MSSGWAEVPFVKGHGTENDFLLVADPDGERGALPAELVRRMCDRRAGIGADGVIRAVRATASDDPAALEARGTAEWFMDYVNSDGSVSQMCGNGARVFARYLVARLGADPGAPLPVATRAGVKELLLSGEEVTVDMGVPRLLGTTQVRVGDRSWAAAHVDMGNPHAVAFVADLADAGPLLAAPGYDAGVFPDGVNVEFVVRTGSGSVAMRVHERGSGETRSCGTGACAAVVAAAVEDGSAPGAAYDVAVAGGRLRVAWAGDGRIHLTGPAVLVAEGKWFAAR